MKDNEFNPIGIESQLDWPRIRKLLTIGLIASCMVFAGDWILGYGSEDPSLSGIAGSLSGQAGKTDAAYLWAAYLGFAGIVLEGLSYFGIYRLMAEKSPKSAHNLRTGIIGYIAFGACGVHVPCVMMSWLYTFLLKTAPEAALGCAEKFAYCFLIPMSAVFFICFVYMLAAQISAFAKGYTPYPKWCAVFNIGFGMAVTLLITAPFGTCKWANALSTAWISVGNIWQFGGLLVMMKRARSSVQK